MNPSENLCLLKLNLESLVLYLVNCCILYFFLACLARYVLLYSYANTHQKHTLLLELCMTLPTILDIAKKEK